MTIRNDQTKAEFIEATLRILYTSLVGKATLWLGIFLLIMVVLNMVTSHMMDYPISLSGLIMPFFLLLVLPAFVYWNTGRVYNQKEGIISKAVYTFSEEGYTSSVPGADAKVAWNLLHDVKILGKSLVLFHSKQIAVPIPTRLFSESELQTVLDWSKANK